MTQNLTATLDDALESIRVVPLPDETGLGLMHLALDPALSLASAFGQQDVAGKLQGFDGDLTNFTGGLSNIRANLAGTLAGAAGALTGTLSDGTGEVSGAGDLTGQGDVVLTGLQSLSDLAGIRFEAEWRTLDRELLKLPPGSPIPDRFPFLPDVADFFAGKRFADTETLLPISFDPGQDALGGPQSPVKALDVSLLPVPRLSHLPDFWSSEIGIRISARAFGEVRTLDLSLPLTLPSLTLPPIAVLCTGRHFQLPALAICPTPLVGGSLDGLLGHLAGVLERIDLIQRLLVQRDVVVPRLSAVTDAARFLLRFLSGPNVRLLTSPAESNLNQFELMLGLINDLEAEDEIRSLLYFGLDGPSVEIFAKRSFAGDERLRVGVTAEMARKGQFLVMLEDLAQCKGEPGVLAVRGDGLPHFLFWSGSSSYRFRDLERTPGLGALQRVRPSAFDRFNASRQRGAALIEAANRRRRERLLLAAGT